MPNHVYLISRKHLSVTENRLPFESFSIEDSVSLFQSLYENWLDNIFSEKDYFIVFSFLNEDDKSMTGKYLTENNPLDFCNNKNLFSALRNRLEKLDINNFPKLIFIFTDSIGISIKDLKKYFNALDNDDNNLLIIKDRNDNICLFGINYFNINLLESLFYNELKVDKFLKQYKGQDFFLLLYDGMLQINGIEDFKQLYKLLSTKESIEFCSQEMHEKFTHLFIEYKELL